MNFFLIIMTSIFGTCVGSFVSCSIVRLQISEDILFKRSHCDHCNHILSWYELIPIVSYLCLKGKCHHCKESIDFRVVVSEILSGLAFAVIGFFIIESKFILALAILIFVISALWDMWTGESTYPLMILFTLLSVINFYLTSFDILFTTGYLSFIIILFASVSRFLSKWMGGADIIYLMGAISFFGNLSFAILGMGIYLTVTASLALIVSLVHALYIKLIRKKSVTLYHYEVRLLPYMLIGFCATCCLFWRV